LPFEEIDAFREKMIKVIQEVGKRKKDEEKEEQGINSTKKSSIKRVEDLLKKRGIKVEELEPNNRDYKKAINNAGETSEEVIDVEDRIKDDIIIKDKLRKGDSNSETDNQTQYSTDPKYAAPPSKGWWWGKK